MLAGTPADVWGRPLSRKDWAAPRWIRPRCRTWYWSKRGQPARGEPGPASSNQGWTAQGDTGDHHQSGMRLRAAGGRPGHAGNQAGDATIVVAGGQESMSLSTHRAYLRAGQKMVPLEFVDTMIKDGRWDAFHGYHMGTTAENVAQKWQITREQQDQFAAEFAAQGGRGAAGRSLP